MLNKRGPKIEPWETSSSKSIILLKKVVCEIEAATFQLKCLGRIIEKQINMKDFKFSKVTGLELATLLKIEPLYKIFKIVSSC